MSAKDYWKQLEAKYFNDNPVWSVNSQFSCKEGSLHVCEVEASEEDIKTNIPYLWPHQDQCTLPMAHLKAGRKKGSVD